MAFLSARSAVKNYAPKWAGSVWNCYKANFGSSVHMVLLSVDVVGVHFNGRTEWKENDPSLIFFLLMQTTDREITAPVQQNRES